MIWEMLIESIILNTLLLSFIPELLLSLRGESENVEINRCSQINMLPHKICFFNRSPIHYRKNVWMLMDKELPCDFYFGDSRPGGIKPLPYELFEHFKGVFHNVSIGQFYWQKGALKLLDQYTDIITPGDYYCLSTWVMLLRAKRKKKNVYLWTHGAYGNETGLKKWIALKSKKLAKGVFLYGNYARDILVKWGIPKQKLFTIYNSLSYDEQLPLRKSIQPSELFKRHFKNDNGNIVFIGRLTVIKKLDQLLKAVKRLKDESVFFNVTFIGDGVVKAQLETLVAELGLQETVWFYGALYDEKKIAEFLYNADLCVSPGNVGLTAMHAMTFGCPVISHDNFTQQMPEFEAIEPEKTGGFFKENDIEDLAKAIREWSETCGDREAIRKACYKVIDEKYNPHLQIDIIRKAINIQ